MPWQIWALSAVVGAIIVLGIIVICRMLYETSEDYSELCFTPGSKDKKCHNPQKCWGVCGECRHF